MSQNHLFHQTIKDLGIGKQAAENKQWSKRHKNILKTNLNSIILSLFLFLLLVHSELPLIHVSDYLVVHISTLGLSPEWQKNRAAVFINKCPHASQIFPNVKRIGLCEASVSISFDLMDTLLDIAHSRYHWIFSHQTWATSRYLQYWSIFV